MSWTVVLQHTSHGGENLQVSKQHIGRASNAVQQGARVRGKQCSCVVYKAHTSYVLAPPPQSAQGDVYFRLLDNVLCEVIKRVIWVSLNDFVNVGQLIEGDVLRGGWVRWRAGHQ